MAVIDVALIATGHYYDTAWQAIEMTVYNISYTFALYCLYVFYLATKQLIKKFRPISKFAAVKSE